MPKPSATRDASSATALMSVSSAAGSSNSSAAPMPGMKIAPVNTQWSNPFTRVLSDEQHQAEPEEGGGGEQHSGVELHPAVLEGAEGDAALFGAGADAVHGAVHEHLVDHRIGD